MASSPNKPGSARLKKLPKRIAKPTQSGGPKAKIGKLSPARLRKLRSKLRMPASASTRTPARLLKAAPKSRLLKRIAAPTKAPAGK